MKDVDLNLNNRIESYKSKLYNLCEWNSNIYHIWLIYQTVTGWTEVYEFKKVLEKNSKRISLKPSFMICILK